MNEENAFDWTVGVLSFYKGLAANPDLKVVLLFGYDAYKTGAARFLNQLLEPLGRSNVLIAGGHVEKAFPQKKDWCVTAQIICSVYHVHSACTCSQVRKLRRESSRFPFRVGLRSCWSGVFVLSRSVGVFQQLLDQKHSPFKPGEKKFSSFFASM